MDGNWGEWGSYGSCSVSCGAGSKARTRACNNPPAAFGGAACTGASSETDLCDNGVCRELIDLLLCAYVRVCDSASLINLVSDLRM